MATGIVVCRTYFFISFKDRYNAISYTDDFSDPEEKVRAELYIDLIDKYNYQASKDVIEMEKRHKIGHPHKKTDAIIDVLVKKNKKPFMIFELKSPEDYERSMEDSIKTQLFNVAAVEDKGGKDLKYLIYYTRYKEERELREKVITIDYSILPNILDKIRDHKDGRYGDEMYG